MLKIQDGCRNFCTYCIIPYVRGSLRSMPPKNAAAFSAAVLRILNAFWQYRSSFCMIVSPPLSRSCYLYHLAKEPLIVFLVLDDLLDKLDSNCLFLKDPLSVPLSPDSSLDCQSGQSNDATIIMITMMMRFFGQQLCHFCWMHKVQ